MIQVVDFLTRQWVMILLLWQMSDEGSLNNNISSEKFGYRRAYLLRFMAQSSNQPRMTTDKWECAVTRRWLITCKTKDSPRMTASYTRKIGRQFIWTHLKRFSSLSEPRPANIDVDYSRPIGCGFTSCRLKISYRPFKQLHQHWFLWVESTGTERK